jgi:hypothetical protein
MGDGWSSGVDLHAGKRCHRSSEVGEIAGAVLDGRPVEIDPIDCQRRNTAVARADRIVKSQRFGAGATGAVATRRYVGAVPAMPDDNNVFST